MSELTARTPRTVLGILAAIGILAALTMPALAGEEVVWATVTGYAEGTPENNQPDAWGDNCEDAGVNGVDTWELPELPEGMVYSLVVVKAGSEASAPGFVNTLFANPSAGETVWADSDGNGTFSEADKGISHIIVCTVEEVGEPTPTPTPEVTPTPSPTPLGENATPTPSPTPREDTAGGNPTPAPGGTLPDTAIGSWGQVPATVLSLILLVALATLVYARMARQR